MRTRGWLLIIVGILLGAVAGWFYWDQVGCMSGSCAITSDPWRSTIYGAVMGGLLTSSFRREGPKAEKEH